MLIIMKLKANNDLSQVITNNRSFARIADIKVVMGENEFFNINRFFTSNHRKSSFSQNVDNKEDKN